MDIIKGFILGIVEGFKDLIPGLDSTREAPAHEGEEGLAKYFSSREWRYWTVREITAQITVVLVLLIAIRGVVGEFRFIPSESMVPTMKIDDRLFVEKFTRVFKKQYERGDIVIFYPPANATGGVDVVKNDPLSIFYRLTGLPFLPQPEAYIKRVIGLPGEHLEVKADDGVYINGIKLYEPYHFGSDEYLPTYDMEVDIPQDHYFVLGDNRNYSADSHVWGFLPKSRIIGKAAFLIYSPLSLKPELSR